MDHYMGVNPKIGGKNPPNHPLKNRVFHDFHHPFWGTPIFGNTHIAGAKTKSGAQHLGNQKKIIN